MIEFFVKRPVTTLMFVLFFVLLGIVAYPKMNVEANPSVNFPMVSTTLIYPGASPSEMKELVVKPIEDAIAEVSEIKKISSESFNSGAYLYVEFKIGVDVNQKLNEVKEKIDKIVNDLPADLEKPLVEKLNPLEEAVMSIILKSDKASPSELYEYADKTLKGKFTAISGIATVKVVGGQERAIRVRLDPEIMNQKFVTILDVVNAMRQYNINLPGGTIDQKSDSINVRFFGEFQNLEDTQKMPIVTSEGQRFFLKDIANVEDSAKKIESGAIYNGENVVKLSIVKATDGNAVKISRDIQKSLPVIEQNLPEGMSLEIINDTSESIIRDNNSTFVGILIGLLLTVIVLLLFTGNFRTTIIASVVIPASLIAGFFFMNSSGFTINSMTLLAMATALGTLVSNAIVIIESSLGFLNKGKSSYESAILGTKSVLVAILASSLTNLVVFLPIAFMGGIVGQFMIQFGLSVVYFTVISLFFSISLTPMMIALLLKKTTASKNPSLLKRMMNKIFERCDYAIQSSLFAYEKIYNFLFKKPKSVIFICIAILIASFGLLKFIGNEFSPSVDVDEITMKVKAPQGATYSKSEEIVKNIESRLRKFPEVKAVSSEIGDKGTENIDIKVMLTPVKSGRKSDKLLSQEFVPALSDVVDAEIQILPGRSTGTFGNLIMNVYGEDPEKLDAYTDKIVENLNNLTEIQSIVKTAKKPKSEFRFIPDPKKMNFYGVSNQQVGATIRYALYGEDNQVFKENETEYPIIIELSERYKDTKDVFSNIFVNSYKGLVAISELGEVKEMPSDSTIKRKDRQQISEITIILGKSTIGVVQPKIDKIIADTVDFDSGYGYYFAGMSETQAESNVEIGNAFLLAIILTYMVLAAILNSFVHPFTIASSIITSFAGVFFMLFITGASINVAALLAVIMLVGLAVNNSILLLEPTIQMTSKGEDVKKSLWKSFQDKYKMILMSSIAVISGMVPQLWSNDQTKVSMGAVIIGGMLGSLIFTFILTPVLFMYFDKLSKKKKKL